MRVSELAPLAPLAFLPLKKEYQDLVVYACRQGGHEGHILTVAPFLAEKPLIRAVVARACMLRARDQSALDREETRRHVD